MADRSEIKYISNNERCCHHQSPSGLLICGTGTVNVHLKLFVANHSNHELMASTLNSQPIQFTLQYYFPFELIFLFHSSLKFAANERNMS